MRVLFLNASGNLGGAERCLLDMIASLQQTERSVAIHLLTASAGPLSNRAEAMGVSVRVLPMPVTLCRFGDSGLCGARRWRAAMRVGRQAPRLCTDSWNYVRSLRRMISQMAPDVIHSNSIKFHILARLASNHHPPIVWHVHDFLSARPLAAKALRWSSTRCDAAVAVSHAIEVDVRRTLRDVQTTVVYNGVDTSRFCPGTRRSHALDELAGLPPADAATARVGLVATYARWKGQDVFVKAAVELARRAPRLPIRFYIIGGPIYETAGSQWSEKELRSLAEEVPPPVSVGFIPFQEDTAAIYRDLDIVVHASTSPEPFGRTIVEAMACARPVIVTETGGAVELFEEDRDAIGVPVADASALASAVERLARDPQLRQRLSSRARETAVSKFDRVRLGSQLLAVYQSVLERRTKARSA